MKNRILFYTIFIFCFPSIGQTENNSVLICDELRSKNRILQLNDLDALSRSIFSFLLDHYQLDVATPPGEVQADFNGDGDLDCAFLVIRKPPSDDRVEYDLHLIIKVSGKKEIEVVDLSPYTGYILLPMRAGTVISLFEDTEGTSSDGYTSKQLEHPGFRLHYPEKGEVAYYWSSKTSDMETMTTSD